MFLEGSLGPRKDVVSKHRSAQRDADGRGTGGKSASGKSTDNKGTGGKSASGKNTNDIKWHPAFFEAIKLELAAYKDDLHFRQEFQLGMEPLRIDVVIVKKNRDIAIDKNIASIFRRVNILEYKSPSAGVSVKDFHKVHGYASLYVAKEREADMRDTTLTIVASSHPSKLFSYLRKVLGLTVAEKWPGIYIVSGDVLAIQIIDSRKLSADENVWLKGLRRGLNANELLEVTGATYRFGESGHIGAYLDAITRANPKSLKEAFDMSETTLTLEQVLEDVGLTAKWEARGETRGEARGITIGETRGITIGQARGEARERMNVLSLIDRGYTTEDIRRELSGR